MGTGGRRRWLVKYTPPPVSKIIYRYFCILNRGVNTPKKIFSEKILKVGNDNENPKKNISKKIRKMKKPRF
jgi:hypothetical protein